METTTLQEIGKESTKENNTFFQCWLMRSREKDKRNVFLFVFAQDKVRKGKNDVIR